MRRSELNRQRLLQLLQPLRSPWVVGALVLFIAVYALLLMQYQRQMEEQDKLKSDIVRLGDIAARGSRSQEIAQAEAKLKAIQESIPDASLREIDVFRTMQTLVSENGLDSTTLTMELKSETPRQKVGNAEYRVLLFNMSFSGDYSKLWDFVQMLDRGEMAYKDLKTLVLDKASLTLGESGRATVDFKIYTQPAPVPQAGGK